MRPSGGSRLSPWWDATAPLGRTSAGPAASQPRISALLAGLGEVRRTLLQEGGEGLARFWRAHQHGVGRRLLVDHGADIGEALAQQSARYHEGLVRLGGEASRRRQRRGLQLLRRDDGADESGLVCPLGAERLAQADQLEGARIAQSGRRGEAGAGLLDEAQVEEGRTQAGGRGGVDKVA